MSFEVRFWGVRGSIACASSQYTAYGGNTSCIEVRIDDRVIVLDAGTGIRELGKKLLADNISSATLMFTHTHWDHINGFPFFGPAFNANSHFSIHAGHLSDLGGIENVLANQMANPTFPVPLEAMQAELDFVDFHAGEAWELYPGVKLITQPLNHPNGATGYRIEHGGKSLCYVTDTEHIVGMPDQTVLSLIEGADLVIYDSMYTDEEFPAKIGWGHSTWEEGIRLCKLAGVKQLAIFHHDPAHNDDFMRDVEHKAREMWDGALVSREHMILTPGQ